MQWFFSIQNHTAHIRNHKTFIFFVDILYFCHFLLKSRFNFASLWHCISSASLVCLFFTSPFSMSIFSPYEWPLIVLPYLHLTIHIVSYLLIDNMAYNLSNIFLCTDTKASKSFHPSVGAVQTFLMKHQRTHTKCSDRHFSFFFSDFFLFCLKRTKKNLNKILEYFQLHTLSLWLQIMYTSLSQARVVTQNRLHEIFCFCYVYTVGERCEMLLIFHIHKDKSNRRDAASKEKTRKIWLWWTLSDADMNQIS